MSYKTSIIIFTFLVTSLTSVVASSGTTESEQEESTPAKQACIEPETDEDKLNHFRNKTHVMFCRTVRGIDSWFGNKEQFDDSQFGGKLVLGFRQDEDTGFDPKVRIRLRTKLPNVSKKFNAFIGRTDDEAYIRDSRISGIDSLTNDLNNEDARWLIGLGYRNPNNIGFETSIGARFSSGIQPYGRLRYRHYKEFGSVSSNFSQTIFWQNDDGFGTTSNLQFSKAINENYLSTLSLGATYLKDTEIWETGSSISLYRKLSPRTGILLRSYIFGESGDNSVVDVPEYGISLGYRRPFLKPWLVLKARIENRWEHEKNDDQRKSFAKIGLQFEMTFGNYKRKK